MKTYNVKATMIIDVEYEITADSKDEAMSKFYATDAKEVVEDGKILDVNTENESAELNYATFKVKVKSVDYDVDYSTCYDIIVNENPGIDEDAPEFDDIVYAKMDEIKKSLPQTMVLEITCEKADLDSYVADAISDETMWLINSCDYEILEEN